MVLFLRVVVKIQRRNILVIVLLILFGSTYVIYFVIQQNTETEVRQSLLFADEQDQEQDARFIGLNIESDLKQIKNTLDGLANSQTVQSLPLTSNDTERLMQQRYDQFNSTIDRLFLINKTGMVVAAIAPPGEDEFLGSNLSKRADWVQETMLTEKPVFSNGYVGLDGKFRIGITVPIVNSTTNEFEGLFDAVVPVNQFFEHYGNIYDVNSEFITAYDSNGTLLVTPRAELVGTNVFGGVFQEFVDRNPVYNRILESAVVKGVPDKGIYDIPVGQFLNTAYPIKIDDKPVYAVAIITPTSTIYSAVDKTLQSSTVGVTVLLGAMTLAMVILSLLLYGWQRDLKMESLLKTKQLEEANGRLVVLNKHVEEANGRLVVLNKHVEEANGRLVFLNDSLVASERAKGEFVAMVSHELRTPLLPIKAFAGMLLNPKYTGEITAIQKKAIDSILRNVISLEKLVSNMLNVYRLEVDKLKLSKVETNVQDLIVNEVIEFKEVIRTEDKEKEIRFDTEIRVDSQLSIKCDPQRISQVIGNLVNNSIDFVPAKGGRITIRVEEVRTSLSTEYADRKEKGEEPTGRKSFGQYGPIDSNSKQGGTILFTVEDNGPGFPADKIDHIFQKFYQVDTSLTRKHGGTGLGLAICKGIVESHGGKIWIDREYQNGASVHFTIPISLKEETTENKPDVKEK